MFLIVPYEMHSYLGMKELTLKNLNYWLVCSVYLVVQCSTSCYRHTNKVSHQIPIMLSWFVVAVWLLLDTLLSFCCSLWVDCHRFSCHFLLSFSLDDTGFCCHCFIKDSCHRSILHFAFLYLVEPCYLLPCLPNQIDIAVVLLFSSYKLL